MEWLTSLRGAVVAIDTAPFIYFVERHAAYMPIVKPLFLAIDGGEFTAVTSMLSILEVLVKPIRGNNLELVDQYRDILLNARHIRALPMSHQVAEEAARLRAQFNLKTPDAIQVATAVHANASHFITNDASIPEVPAIKTILLIDLLPPASTSWGRRRGVLPQ
ncbi:MAG TPA: PIN domain-containing protein [Pirellulales bacterium]|jgi:predicted nucleic acid-binding protein